MSNPGDLMTIGTVAERKLPEITALIERGQVVQGWLESAARCECPSLDECALFDDAALPPGLRLG